MPQSKLLKKYKLITHEQIFELPEKFGGGKYSIHPTLFMELELVPQNHPNQGKINVLSIEGKVPISIIPFDLKEIPIPKLKEAPIQKLKEIGESDNIEVIHIKSNDEDNGSINLATGEYDIKFNVQLRGKFLESIGLEPINIEAKGEGVWDFDAGTMYTYSGTYEILSGIFAGTTVAVSEGSKNETTDRGEEYTASEWILVGIDVGKQGTDLEKFTMLDVSNTFPHQISLAIQKFVHV